MRACCHCPLLLRGGCLVLCLLCSSHSLMMLAVLCVLCRRQLMLRMLCGGCLTLRPLHGPIFMLCALRSHGLMLLCLLCLLCLLPDQCVDLLLIPL